MRPDVQPNPALTVQQARLGPKSLPDEQQRERTCDRAVPLLDGLRALHP
jgi:hypothetical protein